MKRVNPINPIDKKFLTKTIFIILVFLFLPMLGEAATITRPIHNTGLIGYWTFDGPHMAGTKVYDQSTNSNDGTLTGGPTRTIGKIGQALDFDGVDDYVDLQAQVNSTLSVDNSWTVSMWFNFDTIVNNDVLIASAVDGTDRMTIMVRDEGTLQVHSVIYNGGFIGKATAVSGGFGTGNWNHILMIWDTSAVTAYLNGVSVAGAASASTNSNAETIIGDIIGHSAGYDFDGKIDEVRIYNRALSADEVRRLANFGRARVSKSPKDRLTNGLVGYWTFDGNDVAGTKAYDQSTNSNTGTLTGGPTRAIGKIGQALDFDGVDDKVQVVGSPLNKANDYTYSLWVLGDEDWDTASSDYGVFNNTVLDANSYHTLLKIDINNTNQLQFVSRDGVPTTTSVFSDKSSWNANQWYHITIVHDSLNNILWYIDGVLDDTDAFVAAYTSESPDFFIGARQSLNNNTYFDGKIDEVRIYNRALSAEEVRELYNMTKGSGFNKTKKNRITDGLVGHWTFDGPDMSGNKAYDQTSNDNDGTLTGGPTRTIGKIGQALDFDGVDDYVTSTITGGGTTNTVTISLWFYADSAVAAYDGLFETRLGGGEFRGILVGGASGNPITFSWVGTSPQYDAATGLTFTTGRWYFVTLVISADDTNIYLYDDTGTLKTYTDTADNLVKDINTTWDIGRDPIGGTRYWPGKLDEVRIYNRALSAEEVRELYNMGR
jgi:hypothetical protein